MFNQDDTIDSLRERNSKSAYYSESVLSGLHHLLMHTSAPIAIYEYKKGKFPILGMLLSGIGVADATGRIIGTLKDKPSNSTQKDYEQSTTKQLLNIIPGIAGFNTTQSKKYYRSPANKENSSAGLMDRLLKNN
jgi:hypothetical protein